MSKSEIPQRREPEANGAEEFRHYPISSILFGLLVQLVLAIQALQKNTIFCKKGIDTSERF